VGFMDQRLGSGFGGLGCELWVQVSGYRLSGVGVGVHYLVFSIKELESSE
jgi:hypothetical protein